MFFVILGALFVPISINPWIIIILVLLVALLVLLQRMFINTGRSVKRMDNIRKRVKLNFFINSFYKRTTIKERSPIFVHTNSSIEGISTVRSSQKQEILSKEFNELCNNHTRPFFGFIISQVWFSMRVDFLCAIFAIVTVYGCIFLKGKFTIKRNL
jgi:ABC-type multidrug transport system fused ATPase/permease subunit